MKFDKKFLFFLATHGCPKQFHVVKKIMLQTKIKCAKANMLSKTSYMAVFREKNQRRERRLG